MDRKHFVVKLVSMNGGAGIAEATAFTQRTLESLARSWRTVIPRFELVVTDVTFNNISDVRPALETYLSSSAKKGRPIAPSQVYVLVDNQPKIGPQLYIRWYPSVDNLLFRKHVVHSFAQIMLLNPTVAANVSQVFGGADPYTAFANSFVLFVLDPELMKQVMPRSFCLVEMLEKRLYNIRRISQ